MGEEWRNTSAICDTCEMEENQKRENEFGCTIEGETVKIFKGGRQIGHVEELQDGPVIRLYPTSQTYIQLSLNEIDIILDNWNEAFEAAHSPA